MSDDIQLYQRPNVRAHVDELAMHDSAADFLFKNGTYDLAITFAYLFWLEFVEIDGCIILRQRIGTLQGWLERMNGDRTSVEAMLNHTHLDFVLGNVTERSLAASGYLGETMQRTWKAALAEQFPDQRFEFEFANDDDPTLTFWKVRDVPEGGSK
ncbi:hypothetical protein [Deinococcus sp.]|uniref:hypothetical protein n=1 Tax=Deinococcus sp. TaxID=47478 RepID=UPI00286E24ED|nr:hypothetical protein [Deinococcus sp.]